ncbi:hypothetical protein GQ600_18983 [Phytophthora cactorum]|nr:hypothetical protein GQ600_18983 [Phytophthora cactorum]
MVSACKVQQCGQTAVCISTLLLFYQLQSQDLLETIPPRHHHDYVAIIAFVREPKVQECSVSGPDLPLSWIPDRKPFANYPAQLALLVLNAGNTDAPSASSSATKQPSTRPIGKGGRSLAHFSVFHWLAALPARLHLLLPKYSVMWNAKAGLFGSWDFCSVRSRRCVTTWPRRFSSLGGSTSSRRGTEGIGAWVLGLHHRLHSLLHRRRDRHPLHLYDSRGPTRDRLQADERFLLGDGCSALCFIIGSWFYLPKYINRVDEGTQYMNVAITFYGQCELHHQ